jgi:DNA-binding NtrC family response regulator
MNGESFLREGFMMNRANVLVVDDDKNVRLSLTTNLESAGFMVCVADNGPEAIGIIGSYVKFDIVFLDLELPDMNGMEVLKSLKNLGPELNVVLMTVDGTTEQAAQAMKLGAVDFIRKPFTPEQVRDVAGSIIKRQGFDNVKLNDCRSMVEYAKSLIVKKEFTGAKEWLLKATTVNPSRPEAFGLLGAMLEMEDLPSEAQKMYQAAVTLELPCPNISNLDHTA